MSRPFVFSFVSVNGARKVLGTREVVRDELEEKLALVEEWLTEKPKTRCATLYGPGMRRRIVNAATRQWMEDMQIIRPPKVREFPRSAGAELARSVVAPLRDNATVFVWDEAIKDPAFLKESWMEYTVAEMKSALRANGLKVSGVKHTLASRLAEAGIAPR